ncbi:MAG: gliding motility-associated C-terminal domain-containing protein [Bacteroidota bacterium]
MKNNIDISEFDKFFKDGLENAMQTPPAGVWESVSGSLTTSAATTTAAVVKTALWLKVGVAIITTSAIILGTVYLTDSEKETMPAVQVQETPVNPTVENNTPTPLAPIENPAITQADQPAGTNGNNTWIDVSFPPKKSEEPQTNYNEVPTDAPVSNQQTDYNSPVTFPADVAPILPKAVVKKKDTSILNGVRDGNEVVENDHIVIKTSDSVLIIPNAFTPNGDGINDTYTIDIKGETSVRIVVLDRNGSKIFETTDKTKGWDPTIDNYPVGTYYVVVYYKFPNSPENKHSQTIILKR